MINYAKRIAELRQSRGLTQKEIAAHLGITVRSYQRYESADREPPLEQLAKIADYFNVSMDYLISRSDDPTYTPRPKKIYTAEEYPHLPPHVLDFFNTADVEEEAINNPKIIQVLEEQHELWLKRKNKKPTRWWWF